MKLDKKKVVLVMAKHKKDRSDIRSAGVGISTWGKALRGQDVRPKTAGRIADALGVDVVEIIADEG